jgi:NitT/TauT family transport system ATP-binding protein
VTHDVDEAIALADRVLLLSPSPARVLAQVPIARPRAARSPAELAAMREEIARRTNHAHS